MMPTPKKTAEQAASAELAIVKDELAELRGWEIEDDDDNALAGEMLANVKGRIKALEDRRTKITKPMNAALREVNDLFREPRSKLEEAERLIKGKIAGYLTATEEQNAAALAAAGAAETADEATAALATVRAVEAPSGVSMRFTFKPRVVNKGLLPVDFIEPDMKAIRARMKTHKLADGSPAPIPGVLFDKVPIVSGRSQ